MGSLSCRIIVWCSLSLGLDLETPAFTVQYSVGTEQNVRSAQSFPIPKRCGSFRLFGEVRLTRLVKYSHQFVLFDGFFPFSHSVDTVTAEFPLHQMVE